MMFQKWIPRVVVDTIAKDICLRKVRQVYILCIWLSKSVMHDKPHSKLERTNTTCLSLDDFPKSYTKNSLNVKF
jgi:hypothetical protein